MRQTNFAATIVAAVVASVKACDPNTIPDQSISDKIELTIQNYNYVRECQTDDNGTFSQFYRRYGDLMPDATLSYDDYITDFINYDLNGDGRVSKLEVINREFAKQNLESIDFWDGDVNRIEGMSPQLFEKMDQKYIMVEGNLQVVSDGKVDRESFKAYAPEILQVEIATQQLITREMRHRDYDYVYSRDPQAALAAFDYEEVLFFNTNYWENKQVWVELVSVVGTTEQGVSREQFRNQANPWIRRDVEYEDPQTVIPNEHFDSVFDRYDTNKNGHITIDEYLYPELEDSIQYRQFLGLYNEMELNDDEILTYDEIYDYFARQRGTDATEATAQTATFMENYSNDGETVSKFTLWAKMHYKFDQELREARVQERNAQNSRNDKYEWWGGWYGVDQDRDDRVTASDLTALFGNERDANSIINAISSEGNDYIMRDETYKWVREVEQPARATIDRLRLASDLDGDSQITLDEWRNEEVRIILEVESLDRVQELFQDYDLNQSGLLSQSEICYYHLPVADWICDYYPKEDDVPIEEPPVEPPVARPPVDFEELWAVLSGVSDGKVSLDDYKKVAHLVWPDASEVEIELHFSTHDLNDDGVVEQHEAKQVVVHTPLLADAAFLARELFDRLDSNDNGMIDLDELVDIYNLFYTLDFVEDDISIEELSMAYAMLVAMIGEPNQDNILKFIQMEMKKAAHGAVEGRR